MKIYPNYSTEHICHYCKKNNAVKESQFEEDWYGVLSNTSIPMSVKYMKVNVGIPRCQQCKTRHNTSELPQVLLFIICFFVGCYLLFFHNGGSGWSDGIVEWGLGFIIIGGISLTISGFVGTLIRYLIHFIFYSKDSKDLGDTRDYNPIRKLIGCGFQYEYPDAAKGKSYRKIDLEHFKITLRTIQETDNCIIEQ